LRADRAEFTATWTEGAYATRSGTLSVYGPAGEQYGTAGYVVPYRGMTTVSVPLTSAGIAALRAGAVVQVDLIPDFQIPSFGYRMFLRAA
jgi:hypothetical protein